MMTRDATVVLCIFLKISLFGTYGRSTEALLECMHGWRHVHFSDVQYSGITTVYL
jgi:hypothetical protein